MTLLRQLKKKESVMEILTKSKLVEMIMDDCNAREFRTRSELKRMTKKDLTTLALNYELFV